MTGDVSKKEANIQPPTSNINALAEHIMDCSKMIELIPQYCRGELDEETRLQIQQHLDACPRCKEECDREQSFCRLLNDGAVPEPPEEYWHGFNVKLIEQVKLIGVFAWKVMIVPAIITAVVMPLSVLLEEQVSQKFESYLGKFIVLLLSYLPMIAAFTILMRWLKETMPSFEHTAEPKASKFRRFITATPLRCKVFESVKRVLLLAIVVFLIIFWYPKAMDSRIPHAVIYTLCGLQFALWTIASLQERIGYLRDQDLAKRNRWFKLGGNAIIVACGLSFLWWQFVGTEVMNEPFQDDLKASSMSMHGDKKDAMALLERSIPKNQGKPRVLYCYYDLGEIYSETGQPEKARQVYLAGIYAFKQMLNHPAFIYVSSDRIDLFEHAAFLYSKLGDRKEAFNAYQGMLQTEPHNDWNMLNVAEGYDKVGYHSQARSLYERVIVEYPNSYTAVSAQMHLAEDYDKEGNHDKAKALYILIISKHPNTYQAESAQQALTKLRESP